ncbi:MAG: nicotinamide riboside transporter PnuC [Muribaculaceae bacterium]|nr:nicotinamide riboside transporter PnuC [Muribaculaceae bacterium]
MSFDTLLEILGFITGLFYLWWEYHASARLWLASIIMPAISMWIYFSKGLYADFSINIYYFVIAIYGYIVWTRHIPDRKKKTSVTLPITHIRGIALWAAAGMFGVLWAAIWAGLHWFTNSNVPVADAFTTSLSIVAMWMLARKYIEQWIAWMAVDAVCVGLYIYKGIYFYAVLYAIYTVIAILGFRKWQRLMS